MGDRGIKEDVKNYLELDLRECEVTWKAWVVWPTGDEGQDETDGLKADGGSQALSVGAERGAGLAWTCQVLELPLAHWDHWTRWTAEFGGLMWSPWTALCLIHVGGSGRGLVQAELGAPGPFSWLDGRFEGCRWVQLKDFKSNSFFFTST